MIQQINTAVNTLSALSGYSLGFPPDLKDDSAAVCKNNKGWRRC